MKFNKHFYHNGNLYNGKNFYLGIITLCRLIFVVNGIVLFFAGDWGKGFALIGSCLLTYLPELYTWLSKQRIPLCARLWYVIFVFACQWLGTYLRFYDQFAWWDILLHFSSGFLLGYIGALILLRIDSQKVLIRYKAYGIIGICIFGFSVSGAVAWEIIEFLADTFLGTFTQLGSLKDTMEDLICGSISAFLFAIYTYKVLKKGEPSYVQKIIALNENIKKEP